MHARPSVGDRSIALLVTVVALGGAGCSATPPTISPPESARGSSPSSAVGLTPAPSVAETVWSTLPDASPPTGAVVVELAGPPPHFVPTELSISGSSAFLDLRNTSNGDEGHNLAIGRSFRSIVSSAVVPKGHSAVLEIHGLAPGTYAFWCTVSDHAQLGMRGAIEVK